MTRQAERYQHELPDRKYFRMAQGPRPWGYTAARLRQIANEFPIQGKRRIFYDRAFRLALDYGVDYSIEQDLLNVSRCRKLYMRAIMTSRRFLDDFESIFKNRTSYSLWHESCFTCQGDLEDISRAFYSDEMTAQVGHSLLLTQKALSDLPLPSPSRKKMLALRKWAAGHRDFWTQELGRPIKVNNDRREGYSWYHRYLRCLMADIDPKAVQGLDTIVREQKAEQRTESAAS